jgi:hypothetical protein
LLFEVFSHRYERGATIVTSRTHHVHILEMNGEGRLAHAKKRVRREKAQTPSETIPRE